MHTFAQPISLHRASHEDRETDHLINTMLIALALALAVALIAGAAIYSSVSKQIATSHTTQIAAQEQSVQANATLACVQTHGVGDAMMAKCRAAAKTYAYSEPSTNPAAFNAAVSFIFPKRQ
jgi:uncharacterized protein HemX